MVFRFRMLSDENDNFVRDYEVPYDMTLLDFHNFILRSLEYEECMASAGKNCASSPSWIWTTVRKGLLRRWRA